jgi:outer membrane receptor for ferrienterochelin and colicins
MKGRKEKICAIVCACLILYSKPNLAAEEEPIEVEKIVVTGSRTEENYSDSSRKIDIIGSKEIDEVQATDLSDVLSYSDSIEVSNYGGPGAAKTLKMRGSTASQVMVLVDGRPINSPRDGQTDLSTIPLDNIDRVEILHGPASSLYGSSAMGGVVQIITKKPPIQGSSTEATSSFGTFRTYQERLSHGQRIGDFGYLVSGGYQSSQGFRQNSAFNSKDLNVKMDYNLTPDQNISVNTGFYNSLVGTPGEITAPDLDDKQRVLKNYIDLNWRMTIDADTTISAKIYNNYDRLEFMENTAGSFFDTPFAKFIHTTQTRGIDVQLDKQFNDFYRAIGGLNYILNLNDSTSTAKHRYTVFAGYLNNEFNIREDLKADLGARIDDYSNFGLQASPSLSLLYKIKEKTKLHGLISRSFRAPTFNDLYWPAEFWPGGGSQGNPNLMPEKGTTGEIGVETEVNQYIQTSMTYFKSFYNDLIQWAPDAVGVWMPTNISFAVIEGVEFKNTWQLIEKLEIGLNYTYQLAKDDKTHKFLVYQPKNKINISVGHKNVLGWNMGINGQWTGLKFNDAENTTKVKGVFVLGFRASKKWKSGVTYFMNINNALNKKYQPVRNYPAPGFDLTSGVKFEF